MHALPLSAGVGACVRANMRLDYTAGWGCAAVKRASDCCAVATFGTQLSNNLSASEVNALVNGSATQSQLDLFASRAGELKPSNQCFCSLDNFLWHVHVHSK